MNFNREATMRNSDKFESSANVTASEARGHVRAPWLLTTHVTSSKIEQVAALIPTFSRSGAAAEERGEGADRVKPLAFGSLAHLHRKSGS